MPIGYLLTFRFSAEAVTRKKNNHCHVCFWRQINGYLERVWFKVLKAPNFLAIGTSGKFVMTFDGVLMFFY